MTTREFLDQLERHPDEPLAFTTERARIASGYHVTEIKAATIRAVDCGGEATRWSETILQVQPSARPGDGRPMSVGKLLGIYRRVADAIPVDADSRVRVEYGEIGQSAVSYLVGAVERGPEGVDVRLAPPAVACKGADRSVGDIPVAGAAPSAAGRRGEGGGCCSPAASGTPAGTCCG